MNHCQRFIVVTERPDLILLRKGRAEIQILLTGSVNNSNEIQYAIFNTANHIYFFYICVDISRFFHPYQDMFDCQFVSVTLSTESEIQCYLIQKFHVQISELMFI